MSTVRRWPRCRTCPSNMRVVRTCGWWSHGRLSLTRSHHISWQVWDTVAVVCSMCFNLVIPKLPPMDGWTDGVTNFFATHTHHDCTWHLQHWTFLLFPPTLDKQPFPQSGQVSFSLWKSRFGCHLPKSDVSIFQHHNN